MSGNSKSSTLAAIMNFLIGIGSLIYILVPNTAPASAPLAVYLLISWYLVPILIWFIHTNPTTQRLAREALTFTLVVGLAIPALYGFFAYKFLAANFGSNVAERFLDFASTESVLASAIVFGDFIYNNVGNEQLVLFVILPLGIIGLYLLVTPFVMTYKSSRCTT